MRVTFAQHVMIGAQAFAAGASADLPDGQAEALLADGSAVAASTAPAEPLAEGKGDPVPVTPAASASRRRRAGG